MYMQTHLGTCVLQTVYMNVSTHLVLDVGVVETGVEHDDGK